MRPAALLPILILTFTGPLPAADASLRLLFSPDGGVHIVDRLAEAPRVAGELPDDTEAEMYSEGQPSLPEVAGAVPESQGLKSVGGLPAQPPADLKRKALEYFNANSGRITNKDFIGIIDFSRHSSVARFFILDLRGGPARAIHVAHGMGSDPDHDGYADSFSNVPNSNASSLGFYLTGETYMGKHGRSMRLHGLSSTNSNALSRAVVIHEAVYVQEADVKQGRSFGCPAVAASEIDYVISSLRGGALIYGGLAGSDF